VEISDAIGPQRALLRADVNAIIGVNRNQ
jgi:hypothetical protein